MKGRQEAGVKVTIITTDPEEIVYGSSDVCHELIKTMQLNQCNHTHKQLLFPYSLDLVFRHTVQGALQKTQHIKRQDFQYGRESYSLNR